MLKGLYVFFFVHVFFKLSGNNDVTHIAVALETINVIN